MVPSEEGIETAYERKKAEYTELAAECREAGWKSTIYPVVVGCQGYEGWSTTRLLRDMTGERTPNPNNSHRG